MKTIKAIIQPAKVDEVRDALSQFGVSGLTISEARGFGRQRGHTETYRGAEYDVDFVPKVEFEVIVEDGQAEPIAEAIMAAAKTGKIGDGKIFVYGADEVIRIRTGETGNQALSLRH